jgi:hypothetical protein
MSLPKNKIKMTLATAKPTTKPNSAVLEKLGMTTEEVAEARKAARRKQELEKVEAAAAAKKAKATAAPESANALIETLKERLKLKVEAGKAKLAAAAAEKQGSKIKPVPAAAPLVAEEVETEPPTTPKGKKVKAKDGAKDGPDSKGRREELLKQLKAVEDAIHRKRTKLDG